MKSWQFYDTLGNLRRTVDAYLYDSAGNRRKIAAGYFYDALGTRRQFFAKPGVAISEVLFPAIKGDTAVRLFSWIVPAGVTVINICTIGGGGGGSMRSNNPRGCGGGGGALAYTNGVPVTPGETLTVQVGYGGNGVGNAGPTPTGGTTRVLHATGSVEIIRSSGGGGAQDIASGGGVGGIGLISQGTGATFTGGNGASGGVNAGGGGGAAGYAGNGGIGSGTTTGGTGSGGGAGGGAAGAASTTEYGGSGGGTGLTGQGASGAGGPFSQGGGRGGSGGGTATDASAASAQSEGGFYGGGGAGVAASSLTGADGFPGAVLIRWGTSTEFPTSLVPTPQTVDFTVTPALVSTNRAWVRGPTQQGTMSTHPPIVKNGAVMKQLLINSSDGSGILIFDNLMATPGANTNLFATLTIDNAVGTYAADGSAVAYSTSQRSATINVPAGMFIVANFPIGTPVAMRFTY